MTLLERDDVRVRRLARGRGDARAGGRGRVRYGGQTSAGAGAALGRDVARRSRRAGGSGGHERGAAADGHAARSPATRTRRASWSASSRSAARWACAPSASARERGARARAGARADDAAGDREPRRPFGRSAAGAWQRCVARARSAECSSASTPPSSRSSWMSTASARSAVRLRGRRACQGRARRARRRPLERADRGAARCRAGSRASGQGPDSAPARSGRPGPAARASCASTGGYLVPRADGCYVLGGDRRGAAASI